MLGGFPPLSVFTTYSPAVQRVNLNVDTVNCYFKIGHQESKLLGAQCCVRLSRVNEVVPGFNKGFQRLKQGDLTSSVGFTQRTFEIKPLVKVFKMGCDGGWALK